MQKQRVQCQHNNAHRKSSATHRMDLVGRPPGVVHAQGEAGHRLPELHPSVCSHIRPADYVVRHELVQTAVSILHESYWTIG